MKIGFKFAKIEYFQNLQESVQNISLPFKYGSLKSHGQWAELIFIIIESTFGLGEALSK